MFKPKTFQNVKPKVKLKVKVKPKVKLKITRLANAVSYKQRTSSWVGIGRACYRWYHITTSTVAPSSTEGTGWSTIYNPSPVVPYIAGAAVLPARLRWAIGELGTSCRSIGCAPRTSTAGRAIEAVSVITIIAHARALVTYQSRHVAGGKLYRKGWADFTWCLCRWA